MNIIEKFVENDIDYKVTILGTLEKPLFKALDVGKILDIKQIRNSLSEFVEDKDKKTIMFNTSKGYRPTIFLTEKGLYKIVLRSRKPNAVIFQDWVCDVVEEIRVNGKYELDKKLEESEKKLEEIENKRKQQE